MERTRSRWRDYERITLLSSEASAGEPAPGVVSGLADNAHADIGRRLAIGFPNLASVVFAVRSHGVNGMTASGQCFVAQGLAVGGQRPAVFQPVSLHRQHRPRKADALSRGALARCRCREQGFQSGLPTRGWARSVPFEPEFRARRPELPAEVGPECKVWQGTPGLRSSQRRIPRLRRHSR
jgi:hypothetical protein